jgi:putative ABC transport system permease protein
MLKNYIMVAFRTIRKSKGFSLLTISGLVVGMVAFAMIMQYVLFELSYDKFQRTSENTYRVAFTVRGNGSEAVSYATTFLPIASLMKDEFPEVVDYNRVLYLDRHAVVTYGDKIFQQENVIYADPSFFTFFNYPLLLGDANRALAEVNTVVISESLARKYFDDKNPIGQFIKLNEEFNEFNLLVTGIYNDIPANTHLKPKMVVSLRSVETLPETISNTWSWPIYLNYVQLQEGTDPALLESKFLKFAIQHIQRNAQKREYSFFLQPLSSIHLHSHLQYEIEENGNATMVYLLFFSAILILIIAYVNYINLTTARSLLRAKEVGVRKVLGSRNGELISQFFIEAGAFNLLALVVATAFAFLVQPYFLDFAGIEFDFTSSHALELLITLSSCLVIGTFLSAVYPSRTLASLKPIYALKGESKSRGGFFARRMLVIFQFTATIGLMINAYAIFLQIDLMRSESPGMNINPILIVNAPRVVEKSEKMDLTKRHEDPFKIRSVMIPGINSVSASASIPGMWITKARDIYRSGYEQEKDLTYYTLGVDFDFLETYSMQLLAGRSFSEQYGTDDEAIILTENAMKQLGFSDPEEALNQRVQVGGKERRVIGIVNDYHHMSLRENYQPIIFYLEWGPAEFYSLKLGETQSTAEVLKRLEDQWRAVYPSNPFEYSFLNAAFQNQYHADVKFGKLFNLFTVLAMILACLGLFGLVSFITVKRTKEIGIRKVLGSTSLQMALLLVKDLGAMLFSAGIISVPIAYFTLTLWLSQFAFRIDLNGWIFAIPLATVVCLALISISYQVIKTAMMNPVKSLKYE